MLIMCFSIAPLIRCIPIYSSISMSVCLLVCPCIVCFYKPIFQYVLFELLSFGISVTQSSKFGKSSANKRNHMQHRQRSSSEASVAVANQIIFTHNSI